MGKPPGVGTVITYMVPIQALYAQAEKITGKPWAMCGREEWEKIEAWQ